MRPFTLGGKQSPKMASINSCRRMPCHPLRDGLYCPLPFIWAGLVTGFARNFVFTIVQFWSSFEKAASYSHFSPFKCLAHWNLWLLLGLGKWILQLSPDATLALFFVGRLFSVHSIWQVLRGLCGPCNGQKSLKAIFLYIRFQILFLHVRDWILVSQVQRPSTHTYPYMQFEFFVWEITWSKPDCLWIISRLERAMEEIVGLNIWWNIGFFKRKKKRKTKNWSYLQISIYVWKMEKAVFNFLMETCFLPEEIWNRPDSLEQRRSS